MQPIVKEFVQGPYLDDVLLDGRIVNCMLCTL